ncbi:FeoC-like transcriptional regulator [Plesiomonas shigelloides subsp. oncorhynchi]|nr:FeoC-like transcriptional regulator [Plesiomonas shigelloides]
MILQDLRDLLQKHGRMTRKDLARQLNSSEDGVDAMLQVWMRKGRVSKDEQKCVAALAAARRKRCTTVGSMHRALR